MKTAQAIKHAFGRFPRAAGVKDFCDLAACEIHEEPEVGLNHYWFPDGSTLTLQGNRLTADVATKDHTIDLLRRLVKWANNQPECYVQGLSVNELQNLYRAHSECDWNYGLDRWSDEQRAEGACTGKAPTFEDSEPLEFKVSEVFLPAIFNADESGLPDGASADLAAWWAENRFDLTKGHFRLVSDEREFARCTISILMADTVTLAWEVNP